MMPENEQNPGTHAEPVKPEGVSDEEWENVRGRLSQDLHINVKKKGTPFKLREENEE